MQKKSIQTVLNWLALAVLGALPIACVQAQPPPVTVPKVDTHPLTITTSWLGNTLLRGPAWGGFVEPTAQRWMMDYMSAMTVSPDGYVFGTTTYEEGIQRTGVYKGGDNVLDRPDGGSPEGTAVAASPHFFALGKGGGKTVRLYKRLPGQALDGKGGSTPGDATEIAVNDKDDYISGLALDEAHDRLYVSFAAQSRVKVFKLSDGAPLVAFPVFDGRPHASGPEGGGKMALDGNGNLWIAQGYEGAGPVKLLGTFTASAPVNKDTTLDRLISPDLNNYDGGKYFVTSEKNGFVTQDLGASHRLTLVHFKGNDPWAGVLLQGANAADGPWTALHAPLSAIHSWPDEWITVNDPAPYRYVRFFNAPGGELAVGLFEVYEDGTPREGRILCYSPDGKKLMPEIALAHPSALAWDTVNNRLLAADNGPNQQICAYLHLDSHPELDPAFGNGGKLGEEGGILAGAPQDAGKIGPRRFDNIRGVGADNTGKVYVAMAGANGVSQTRLECYTPDGKQVWKMMGLAFEDQAAVDPGSETDVYSSLHHYKMDYSKPAGNEWTLVGMTANQRKYGDQDHSGTITGMRRIGGRLYELIQGDRALGANWFRFEPSANGEFATPFAMVRPMYSTSPWPPNQPNGLGRFLWNDLNGDGKFQSEEFEKTNDYLGGAASYDDNADLWFYGYADATKLIHRIAASAPDTRGNLAWHWDSPRNQTYAVPEPFASADASKSAVVTSINYDAAKHGLYVTGFTKDHPFSPALSRNNTFGPVLAHYSVTGGALRLIGTTLLPADVNIGGGDHDIPYSISLAGDYVFIGYWNTMAARIYRKRDLGFVGQYLLGRQTATPIIDGTSCVRAYKRPNVNEYLIFESNYVGNAILMVRWKPDVTAAPPAPDGFQIQTSPAAALLTLAWKPSPGANGYKVERMILTDSGWGAWAEIAHPTGTSYADAVRPAHSYAYRVRAFNTRTGGGNSDYTQSIFVMTDDPASPKP